MPNVPAGSRPVSLFDEDGAEQEAGRGYATVVGDIVRLYRFH